MQSCSKKMKSINWSIEELRNEIEELKKQSRPILSEEMLGEWKEQYRRLGTGEI